MKTNNNGFVALFAVTIIGFLAILFLVTAMPRSWLQARNVEAYRNRTEARFDALSCVHVARQKLSELGVGDSVERVVGNYYIGKGICSVEEVRRQGSSVFVQTRANKNGIEVSLEAVLDSRTFGIRLINQTN